MAHRLKLHVIAEGVETAGQLAYLRRYKCDQIQGYYSSPPVPVQELEPMLREERLVLATDGEARAPLNRLRRVSGSSSRS